MRYALATLIGVMAFVGATVFAEDAPPRPPEPPEPPAAEAAPASPAEPSPRALEGVDFRQAMALANAWGAKVQSSVTTSGVTFVFPDGFRRLVAAPPDQVLIAVAPYRHKTHPCGTHTMSTCLGELFGVPVEVLAQRGDGTVLIRETLTTLANGFIELWLPRELDVHLTLRAQGLAAEGQIRTHRDADTCITTLKLSGDGEERLPEGSRD